MYLPAGCDVRIESVTSCSGATPGLSSPSPSLLHVWLFLFAVAHRLSEVKGEIPPTHTHTLTHTLLVRIPVIFYTLVPLGGRKPPETSENKSNSFLGSNRKGWEVGGDECVHLIQFFFLSNVCLFIRLNHEWLHLLMLNKATGLNPLGGKKTIF